ncbi:MAG: hypothetical protein NZM38_02440 [Cytophagales bacterium]|nr:hypothetical protein [Cytophagales bacterium]MDW8383611.1 hypothetical protein [Flammeovirgaceae bacterium]
MKKALKRFLFYLLFASNLLISLKVFSQPPPPPDPDDPVVPIDGGIGFLAAAGLGYGIKQYCTKRKKT